MTVSFGPVGGDPAEFVDLGYAADDGLTFGHAVADDGDAERALAALDRLRAAGSFSFTAAYEAVEVIVPEPMSRAFDPAAVIRRMTLRVGAGPHSVYTESAARSLIGQRPALNLRDAAGNVTHNLGRGTVVTAEVVDDGRALLITIEQVADEAAPVEVSVCQSCGLGWTTPPNSFLGGNLGCGDSWHVDNWHYPDDDDE